MERVDIHSDGSQSNGYSIESFISNDGKLVTFVSGANNIVDNDTNEKYDIFLHNRETNTTSRINLGSDGSQTDEFSLYTSISADGKYIAFISEAKNLAPDTPAGGGNVFLYDIEHQSIKCISKIRAGSSKYSTSPFRPSISDDGRYTAFYSRASNLVEGDNNYRADVFVYDNLTDTMERIETNLDTAENSFSEYYVVSISGDGQFVAFQSDADNLVPNDTNEQGDTFIYDRNTQIIERISISTTSEQGDNRSFYPSVNANGRFVVFTSAADNFAPVTITSSTNIFIRDRLNNTTELISVSSSGITSDRGGKEPSISGDGRYVVFSSYASNLFPDTNTSWNIYLRDRQLQTTNLVSHYIDGTQSNHTTGSAKPFISKNGLFISFDSFASNLVADDTNNIQDIFITETNSSLSSGTHSSSKTQIPVLMYLLN